MALEASPRLFTVDEYHRMAEVGILCEDDRVELIEGEILQMVPIGPRHNACVARLNHLLSLSLGTRANVFVQGSAQLSDRTQPQPDLAVTTWRDDFYSRALPKPSDLLLVIEVAESSLAYDRAKLSVYAASDVSEVWLVNLPDHSIERYRDPAATGFVVRDVFGPNDSISPFAFPDLSFALRDILGT